MNSTKARTRVDIHVMRCREGWRSIESACIIPRFVIPMATIGTSDTFEPRKPSANGATRSVDALLPAVDAVPAGLRLVAPAGGH
jgi:hypothetical protein